MKGWMTASRIVWLLLSTLPFLCRCSGTDSATSNDERPPNFILIMADDLGYGGIGCYGHPEIRTPNLDKMAAEGLRLSSYYANSTVCTPTRAALLTGRYQQRSGLEGVIYVRGSTRQLGMSRSELTLAEALKANGYSTGIMGKWHLGYRKEFFPTHQGFDEFYGYVSGNIDFHTHYDNAGLFDWWHNLDSLDEPGYVTDLITQHAVEFIENHRNEPFFLYIPHEAPHAPFQGRSDPGYRFPDQDFSYYGPVADKDRAYREMVEVMDEGIGAVFAALKQHNLESNTMVVFVSDNGAERDYGDNGGLRGWKTNLFEGGIRVPGIAWWKGRILPAESDVPVMSFDWMPTFLALSNTKLPAEHLLDGIDLSSQLLNNTPPGPRPLFWRYRQQKAVRENQWKLIVDADRGTMLFNLLKDPLENRNLADQEKATTAELLMKLEEWEREVTGDRPLITN